jgi:hypothetical protein
MCDKEIDMRTIITAMVLAMALHAGCGDAPEEDSRSGDARAVPQEGPMAQDEMKDLRRELAGIWSEVRTAFAEYRLDDALPFLDIPKDQPRPSREEARSMAEFLPDIDSGGFLGFERQGDIAAITMDTSHDPGETEVTVFRFKRAGDTWKIYPPPHSCSSLSVDKTDERGIRRLLAERPMLQLIPGDE